MDELFIWVPSVISVISFQISSCFARCGVNSQHLTHSVEWWRSLILVYEWKQGYDPAMRERERERECVCVNDMTYRSVGRSFEIFQKKMIG